VKRHKVIAKPALGRSCRSCARAVLQGDHNFVRSSKDSEVVETFPEPDTGCPSALRAAREKILVDFLFQRAAILRVEDAKHGTGGQQCSCDCESKNSAAQALEARKRKREFVTCTRRGLNRARSSVHGSGF